MCKHIVHVTSGHENVNWAINNDPDAIDLTARDHSNNKRWVSRSFKTEEESIAFRLGLIIGNEHTDVYWESEKIS